MPYTATNSLVLPSTVTGSWPRPRWFDMSMWAKPLDTCMLDVRFREKFQDALAVVISDEERAGLDILTHGDYHCDEDFAGRSWHHYPLQRWTGFEGDYREMRRYAQRSRDLDETGEAELLALDRLLHAAIAFGDVDELRTIADAMRRVPNAREVTAIGLRIVDAATAALEGRSAEARRLFEEAFARFEKSWLMLDSALYRLDAIRVLPDAPEAPSWAARTPTSSNRKAIAQRSSRSR